MRRFAERFFVKARYGMRRNTLCISSVPNRSIGGKDPAKRDDELRGAASKNEKSLRHSPEGIIHPHAILLSFRVMPLFLRAALFL